MQTNILALSSALFNPSSLMLIMENKATLRRKILKIRDSLSSENVSSLSTKILERLFSRPMVIQSKKIAFYMPKGNEVDTRMMIYQAKSAGKEVLLPITKKELEFHPFHSFADLHEGKYGILEPPESKPIEPEVIIVPGISFGLCMHRLGYGKGYYDRYLSKSSAYRVGICYDFQVVEKLPSHPHDQRLNEIVSEKRVII